MKAKNTFDKHQEQIALKTLKMSAPMLGVMGGMDKQEAIKFLKSIGYSDKEIKKLSESRVMLKDLIKKEGYVNSPLNTREMEQAVVKPKLQKYKAYIQFEDNYADISKEYDNIYKNKWTYLDLPRNHVQQWAQISNDKKVIKGVAYKDGGLVGVMYVKESIIKEDSVDDIMNKYRMNEKFIASNQSYWQWEYDHSINHAFLFMKENGDLRLAITNQHIKSGLGKGEFFKELENEHVGSVRKPDLARIKNLLKQHGHQRTRAGGPFKTVWHDHLNNKEDSLANIIKQYTMTNEAQFKKGQVVKYIVPGTTDKIKTGKITGFKSTRTEDFAVIGGKTIPFSHLSEAASFKKQPRFVAEFSTKSVNQSVLKDFFNFLSEQDIEYYYNKQHQTLELDEKDANDKYVSEMIDDIGLKEI